MKSIAQNPLALAALYRSGLGKNWENQSQAAKALARLNVSRVHLNRAVRVAALPETVLSLFSSTGMLDITARELLRIERKLGAEQLAARAAHLSPDGRSWSEIVAMLEGKEPVVPAYAVHIERRLLERAAQYAEGLASGLWSSVKEAAQATGWDRGDLYRAIAVSRLPAAVIDLFGKATLSREIGDTLLSIEKTIGAEKMLRNARAVRDRPKRRTTNDLLNALAGAKDYSDMSLKIRGTGSKITLEMTFDVEDAEQLLLDEDEVKGHIQAMLMLAPQREKRKKR